MKKGDYVVILAIILIAVGIFFETNKKNISDKNKNNSFVIINVDGKEYSKYKLLGTDEKINVKTKYGENTIEIKKGKVNMTHSDCKDQLCVEMNEISKSGESIICLPNRTVVTIKSINNDLDVVLHWKKIES